MWSAQFSDNPLFSTQIVRKMSDQSETPFVLQPRASVAQVLEQLIH